MANDYIRITTTSNSRASKHAQFINHLREIQEQIKALRDKMQHSGAAGGSLDDAAAYEAAFGIPAGQGAAHYALFLAMYSRVNHADVDLFIERVGE